MPHSHLSMPKLATAPSTGWFIARVSQSWLGTGAERPIRLVAALWSVYFVALVLIDRMVMAPRQSVAGLPWRFYILQCLVSLILLALSFIPSLRIRLGTTFLPLVVIWLIIMPLLICFFIAPDLLPGPITSPEGMMLRLWPSQLVVLVLVAWHYRWRWVVFTDLVASALTLGMLTARPPVIPPRFEPLAVVTFIFASYLAIGTSVKWLMNRLQTQRAMLEVAHTQLQHYASTLESLTITRERNRVARELHDTLAHTLSGLVVQLETVKAYWDVDPKAARTLLESILSEARHGLDETRRALKAIRAAPLDDLGLSLAIQTMAATVAERAHLALDFRAPSRLPSLPSHVEQCVYRVAQEAVANAVYHANAQRLTVQLALRDSSLILRVQDDGQGFDIDNAERPGHFGLAGMRERAALAGGQLSITSQPGQGTLVELVI